MTHGRVFPNQAPLPNRVNVVLTRDRSYQKEGVVLVHDMEELGEELKKYPDGDVFVIGGESILPSASGQLRHGVHYPLGFRLRRGRPSSESG